MSSQTILKTGANLFFWQKEKVYDKILANNIENNILPILKNCRGSGQEYYEWGETKNCIK